MDYLTAAWTYLADRPVAVAIAAAAILAAVAIGTLVMHRRTS